MWYSRYKFAGVWRHVVIFVNGNKYEFRKDPRTNVTYDEMRVQYSQEGYNNAEAMSELILGCPQPGKHYITRMVGWTSLSHPAIDRICHGIRTNWKYNLAMNNC